MDTRIQALENELGKFSVWEKDQILSIVDGDGELYHDLMDAYCEDALTGLEEISIALSSGSLGEVEHSAHALKGSSANMGGERAREASWWMENAAREAELEFCRLMFQVLDREITNFVKAVRQVDLKDIL
jgi:two-component system sensor histidine kinase/response regulator